MLIKKSTFDVNANTNCISGTVPPSPLDPSLKTVPLEDGGVSEEVPRVGLEEMLQEMNISDEGGGGARGEQ